MKKQKVKILLTVICMLAAGICYSCSGRTDRSEENSHVVMEVLKTEETSEDRDVQNGLISAETKAQEADSEDSGKESWEEPMARQRESVCFYVHICGEVRNPGVYEMEMGSRIFQAVELAGGFTEEADKDCLNMALEIKDGMKITVPSRQEMEEARVTALGQWIEMPEDSCPGTGNPGSTGADGDDLAGSSQKVNLNTASKEELMTLRGIGEARAEDIIRYRQEQGSFQAVEEIMNVSGIKEAAFQKIKDSITVQDTAP